MRMRQSPGGRPDVGDGGRFPPRVYAGANGERRVARRAARPDLPQHAADDEGVARDDRAPPRHQPVDHRQLRGGRRRRAAARQGNRPHRARLLRAAAARSGAHSLAHPRPHAGACEPGQVRQPTRHAALASADHRPAGPPPARSPSPRASVRRPQLAPRPAPAGTRAVCAERAGCARRRPGLSGARGAAGRCIAPSLCCRTRPRLPCVPAWTISCSSPHLAARG